MIKKNKLFIRIVSALIITVPGYLLVVYSPICLLASILFVILLLINLEYKGVLENVGIRLNLFWLGSYSTLYFITFLLIDRNFSIYIGIGLILIHAAAWLLTEGYWKQFSNQMKFYSIYILWVVLPILSFIEIRSMNGGAGLLFFFILIIAANDIFAYFCGKQFGKHPLAPGISPNKTIEGSLCGILSAILVSLILLELELTKFEMVEVILVSILVSIFAQSGDLLESKFKRFAGVKDSGSLIPGHGGILDRMDGYILATPLYSIYFHILHPELNTYSKSLFSLQDTVTNIFS